MFVSFVIAAYNEEGNIRELTERIVSSAEKLGLDFEILHVVEGTDRTAEHVRNMRRKDKRIRLLYSAEPLGLGGAYRKGFQNIDSKTTHVMTMDADLNHRPEEMCVFFNALEGGKADMAVGSRYVRGGSIDQFPLHKRIISKATNEFMNIFFRDRVNDATSNYRLYTRRVVDIITPAYKSRGFEFIMEILFILSRHDVHVVEVPIAFQWRVHGTSKLDFKRTGRGYMRLVWRRIAGDL